MIALLLALVTAPQDSARYMVWTKDSSVAMDSLLTRSKLAGFVAFRNGPGMAVVTGVYPQIRDSLRRWKDSTHWVRRIELDQLAALDSLPEFGAPMEAASWGRDATKAPLAWRAGVTGQGVIMGVIDSGIDSTDRSDFAHLIEMNTSFDGAPDDAIDTSAGACRGHGRWTASAMASRTWGVAPDATLIVAKGAVSYGGSCGMYASSMIQAFQRMTALGATIVNVSYDMNCYSSGLMDLPTAAQHGVVLFGAAGNYGAATPVCPGGTPGAVAVMAIDQSNTLASFSNQGGTLSAPGVNVDAAGMTKSGTSMASPYAAAVGGLVRSACPTLGHDALIATLTSTMDSLPGPAVGAVNAARGVAGCHGGLYAPITAKNYMNPTTDSLLVLSSVPWTVQSSRSHAFRRGDYVIYQAVAGDTLRVIR